VQKLHAPHAGALLALLFHPARPVQEPVVADEQQRLDRHAHQLCRWHGGDGRVRLLLRRLLVFVPLLARPFVQSEGGRRAALLQESRHAANDRPMGRRHGSRHGLELGCRRHGWPRPLTRRREVDVSARGPCSVVSVHYMSPNFVVRVTQLGRLLCLARVFNPSRRVARGESMRDAPTPVCAVTTAHVTAASFAAGPGDRGQTHAPIESRFGVSRSNGIRRHYSIPIYPV
jgi:hypothetical protein